MLLYKAVKIRASISRGFYSLLRRSIQSVIIVHRLTQNFELICKSENKICKNRLEVMPYWHYSASFGYPELPPNDIIRVASQTRMPRDHEIFVLNNWKQAMPHKLMQRSFWLIAGAFFAVFLSAGTQAQVLDSTVTTENGINRNAAVSQKRVTSLAQQTSDLLAEYWAVVRETEGLKIYNDARPPPRRPRPRKPADVGSSKPAPPIRP